MKHPHVYPDELRYSPELAAILIERIRMGESARKIGKDANMPGYCTIYRWRIRHPEFKAAYDAVIGESLQNRSRIALESL